MPGGGPAGTVLGMFLFIIMINPVGRTHSTQIGKEITTSLRSREPIKTACMKYIDDLTVAESIKLKESLQKEDRDLPKPLNYHNRTAHKLTNDKCQLQDMLNSIDTYADENQLLINERKTKLIMFNKSQKYDLI